MVKLRPCASDRAWTTRYENRDFWLSVGLGDTETVDIRQQREGGQLSWEEFTKDNFESWFRDSPAPRPDQRYKKWSGGRSVRGDFFGEGMKLVKQAFRTHPGGSRPLLSPAQSCAHPSHPWAGRQPSWQGPSASSPPGRARPRERLRNPARLVGAGACSPEGSRRRDAAQIWDHHSSSDQPVRL